MTPTELRERELLAYVETCRRRAQCQREDLLEDEYNDWDCAADELSAILSRSAAGEVRGVTDVDVDRAAFEKWVPSSYRSLRGGEVVDFDGDFGRYEDDHPESGQYANYLIEGAWTAWQARAALESLPAVPGEVSGVSEADVDRVCKKAGATYDIGGEYGIVRHYVRYALESLPGVRELDGWVLVPVEPTKAMCTAGDDNGDWGYWESSLAHRRDSEGTVVDIYKAMISAAPSHKETGE